MGLVENPVEYLVSILERHVMLVPDDAVKIAVMADEIGRPGHGRQPDHEMRLAKCEAGFHNVVRLEREIVWSHPGIVSNSLSHVDNGNGRSEVPAHCPEPFTRTLITFDKRENEGVMDDIVSPVQATGHEKSISLVKASYAAYVSKDRAALEKVLADDFHFTSPLDNRLDRKTYFERCWPNSEKIRTFEFVNLTSLDGRKVFITYVAANFDGHSFRNTEIMTIRDGKIQEVEVYFGWSIPHEAKPGGFIDQ
jgi:ketosteroid isomerase-like protein